MTGETRRSPLLVEEDWWTVWFGLAILLIAPVCLATEGDLVRVLHRVEPDPLIRSQLSQIHRPPILFRLCASAHRCLRYGVVGRPSLAGRPIIPLTRWSVNHTSHASGREFTPAPRSELFSNRSLFFLSHGRAANPFEWRELGGRAFLVKEDPSTGMRCRAVEPAPHVK